jgi:hypothetical protein
MRNRDPKTTAKREGLVVIVGVTLAVALLYLTS